MVNFGPLAAEIVSLVWDTPANFDSFRVFATFTAWYSSSGRQPNFVVLNRGRHLYSAGRPSRWASAHILVLFISVWCNKRAQTCNSTTHSSVSNAPSSWCLQTLHQIKKKSRKLLLHFICHTVQTKVKVIFWRPLVKWFALCYRSVVCLSCLSATLVYRGQAVRDQDAGQR